MNSSAISHLVAEPDWLMLRCLPSSQCAEAIQAILKALEGADRWVYAMRGEALRLFDERQLYTEFIDPSTKKPCTCTFRWLQIYLPDSYRYCEEALRNRQALHSSVPLEIAAKATRANLRLLESTSESVRKLPEVHEAAVAMTETQFAAKLSVDYDQHLERRETLKITLSAGDMKEVYRALDWIAEKAGLDPADRSGQILAWAIDANMEHAVEYEQLKAEATA